MRQRRASMDETRARILDAAIELYETAGPSGTSMSAAADRAGVTRATLYRHFGSDAELAEAVLAEWLATAPPVNTSAIAALAGSPARLRHGLDDLYSWYRATEAITANLLRDAHLLPANRQRDLRAAAAHVRDAVRGRGSGEGGPLSDAVLNHAVAFETWRSLRAQGLDDAAIAELMEQFLVAAAAVPDRGKKAAGVRRVRNVGATVTSDEPARVPAAPAAPARATGRPATRANAPTATPQAATRATAKTIETRLELTSDREPAPGATLPPATPNRRPATKPAKPASAAPATTAATPDPPSAPDTADRTKKGKSARTGKGKTKAGKKGKGERKARERDSASR